MQLGVCKHLYPQIILMSSQHPSAPAKMKAHLLMCFLFCKKAEGVEGDR